MPAVVVPELKSKFALLRTYTSRHSWEDLGEAFGKPGKTLQYWAHGSRERDPDRLPDWALPTLRNLIAGLLPEGRSDDEVRDLVFGPAALIEEIVRSGAAASIAVLLATEARQDTATLIRRARDIGLIEVEDDGREAGRPRLDPGEWFRVEFPRLRTGRYALALQNAQQAWAVLRVAVLDEGPSAILVPGIGANGEPLYMRERRDLGRHQFVCFEAPLPFPAFLDAHRRDGTTLDKRGLDELVSFFKALPKSQRACQRLVVSVEAANAP